MGLEICIFASFAVKLMLQSTGHTLRDTKHSPVAFSHIPSFAKICLHIVFWGILRIESHWWKTPDQLCWGAPGSMDQRGDKEARSFQENHPSG